MPVRNRPIPGPVRLDEAGHGSSRRSRRPIEPAPRPGSASPHRDRNDPPSRHRDGGRFRRRTGSAATRPDRPSAPNLLISNEPPRWHAGCITTSTTDQEGQ